MVHFDCKTKFSSFLPTVFLLVEERNDLLFYILLFEMFLDVLCLVTGAIVFTALMLLTKVHKPDMLLDACIFFPFFFYCNYYFTYFLSMLSTS